MESASTIDDVGLLTNSLDYTGIALQSFKQEKDEIFRDLQGDKIGSLKKAIEDLQELIKLRERLNKEIFDDITQMKLDVTNFLNSVPSGGTFNPAIVSEQLKLWQKQVEIDQIRVREKLDCWRDIAELRKELRERIQEYNERESRVSVLDKIFEE
jgi:RNA processing factor Prp31